MVAVTYLAGARGKYKAKHVLVLGDGFRLSEMSEDGPFGQLCSGLVAALSEAGWVSETSLLCLWKAKTYVTENNAEQMQAACADPPPDLPLTRFKTHYAVLGGACKYLAGESPLVRDAIDELTLPNEVEKFDLVLVLINVSQYGGYCSGDIAWACGDPAVASNMAMHELGHAYGLLDEYENACDEADRADLTVVENQPNITSNPLAPAWWPAGAAAPKVLLKANPTDCELPQVPPGEEFQLFQGGNLAHVKYFRSALRCRMKDIDDDFCEVCRTHIVRFLDPKSLATETDSP